MKKLKHGSEGNVISHITRMRRRVTTLFCAALVVGVAAACEDTVPPVFEVPGGGSVEGILFLDVNRDGKFDPSAGDRALPNLTVRVLERGTTQVLSGATGKTDAAGRFTIASVPIGTHELSIDTTGAGAGVAFCQNPIPLSVFLNETQFQEVAARGGCIVTIAEAEKSATGKPVTVSGTVTAAPGQIGATRLYLEDATGGIRVDGLSAGAANVGDIIEVAGVFTTATESEAKLTSPKINSRVVGTAVTPLVVTTKQITDAGLEGTAGALNGRLVIVKKARLAAIFGDGEPSTRNAKLTDGSGNTVLRIESAVVSFPNASDVVPGLGAIVALNKCYDITGIASNFNTTGELFPRTLADIKEVSCN